MSLLLGGQLVRRLLVATFGLSILVATDAGAQLPTATRAETLSSESAQADKELNRIYQALMRRLSPSDQAGLRIAEQTWLKFREADCKYGWWDARDCYIQRTIEREKQLRASSFRDAQGKSFELPADR
jgi:uncharacterized protein YecT (DUF1311 family)